MVARPARDLLQAARQQLTKDWWDLKRENHELFTSQVVLDEITDGEVEMARQRLKLLRGVPLLELNVSANDLGRKILRSGLLPPRRMVMPPTLRSQPCMKWIYY